MVFEYLVPGRCTIAVNNCSFNRSGNGPDSRFDCPFGDNYNRQAASVPCAITVATASAFRGLLFVTLD